MDPQLSQGERDVDGAATTIALRRICSTAAVVLSASGVSISLIDADGHWGLLVGTTILCRRIEQVESTVGEGPCHDAFSFGRAVIVDNLQDAAWSRWPGFAQMVHGGEVAALFSFPLGLGIRRLGVLTICRAWIGPLTRSERDQAFRFAALAFQALVKAQALTPSIADGSGFDPLGANASLYQAQGMVAVQLQIGLGDALARLRAYSFSHATTVSDVANAVLSRSIEFRPDD